MHFIKLKNGEKISPNYVVHKRRNKKYLTLVFAWGKRRLSRTRVQDFGNVPVLLED